MLISGRETMRFSVASSEVGAGSACGSERQPQELLAGEGLSLRWAPGQVAWVQAYAGHAVIGVLGVGA